MKKIAGGVLIILPFVALFAIEVSIAGWEIMLTSVALAILVCGLFWAGKYLMTDGKG